jgi:hypothetical protein
MKIFHSAKLALLAPAVALTMTLTGCSGEGANPSPTPEAVGQYTGQDLPEIVEELEGTPIYSESVDLAPLTNLKGATYLIIAPQDPLNALLVVEEGASPEDVIERKSAPVKLAGKRESLDAGSLVKHVKDEYQLDLKTDDKGQVIVLRVAAKDSPVAKTTPAVTATPQSAATPQDESTPNVE